MTMKNKGITSAKKYFSTNMNVSSRQNYYLKKNIFIKEYEFYAFYNLLLSKILVKVRNARNIKISK